MSPRAAALPLVAALSLLLAVGSRDAAAAETEVVLTGEAPTDEGSPDHFFLEFEVPPGTAEIEVAHHSLDPDGENILDWGLEDPAGFRGWGGGNTENAIVGELAASRSYLAGPIAAGTWRVVVGKAKLVNLPAAYEVVVTLRDAPTLAPQPERQPYAPVDLGGGPRWVAGDLHVHSRDSGDATPSLDAIADFARSRGLDFALIADHNTTSHLDLLADAQGRHPDLLFVPGMELTTYDGHANAIGLTSWVNHRIGAEGATIAAAAAAVAEQGALLSINHPSLDLGDLCIGCAWKQPLDPAKLAAVEVATGGLDKAGQFFTGPSIKIWDDLCAEGHHLAAIGGSDDHRAGADLGAYDSPIGDPTTMVYVDSLSTAALLEGIRGGRTVVKLQGPGDPMIEIAADAPREGDTIVAADDTVELVAAVSGAPAGSRVRWRRDGAVAVEVAIPEGSDPFELRVDAAVPAEGAGESRWRAEVLVDGALRTLTSHVWLRRGPASGATAGATDASTDGETSGMSSAGDTTAGEAASATTAGEGPSDPSGCACALREPRPRDATPPTPAAALLLLLCVRGRRRR